MTIYEETKMLMNKYNIHPNKRLGQNFLTDEKTLETIVEDVQSDDTIIEIGPGLGTLTAILAEKASEVIAIELDPKMVEILQDRFKLYSNVEIINKDVLKININDLAENAKVVANLPYYITTPIITNLLKTNIEEITILIQKEVAERICAEPGTELAGAITYYTNYYADCEIIADVPKEYFIPHPEVESAVVKMKKIDIPRVEVKSEEFLFELIRANFSKRRKTLLNSLANVIPKEKLTKALDELQINPSVRGETLTLEEFAKITNLCYNRR